MPSGAAFAWRSLPAPTNSPRASGRSRTSSAARRRPSPRPILSWSFAAPLPAKALLQTGELEAMDRSNHYEAAFEAYLQWHKLCYVGVDETRRSRLGETPVKSLDFIVYGESGSRLLVDVKGR